MDPAKRPDTKDCIFIATHEPCSLCLSAITWTGFDNFWYLFSYTSTKDAFNIPHDLKILDEVFAVKNGNYRRENSFWEKPQHPGGHQPDLPPWIKNSSPINTE
jgi:tRNA(Arg) A34 adenosine deaminase TadA